MSVLGAKHQNPSQSMKEMFMVLQQTWRELTMAVRWTAESSINLEAARRSCLVVNHST